MARALSTRFAVGALEASAVLSFREEHELGRPPELSIVALFSADIDPGELLGKPARLLYAAGGGPEQSFAGVVGEVEVVGQARHDPPVFRYEFRIATPLGLLAQNVETRIFQGQDVKAVVTAVLGAGGVSPSALRWRLSASYAPYAYKVQYQESDLAFVSRLLEREGIFFFVEPDADEGLAYVFADDGAAVEPIEGGALPWADLSALQGDDDAIAGASDERRLAFASVALGDVDFERPELDLSAHAAAGSDGPLEWYEHPGAYREPTEGKRLANVRLQALRGPSHRVAIEADAPRLRAGRKVTLVDGPAGLDGTYLVVAVEHALAETPEAGERRYRTHATLQPESLPFRTPQRTPRPIIDGPQTAVVVAPRGSPSEAIHTDELGRCKVKFAWDLGPDLDDKASHWVRVAQLQTSGSMILPRLDWEVLVDYVEGDPDRPTVVGRLINGLFMPPYALPEGKTRTALRSASTPGGGGANEVRFEDKAGAEEIMIAAQYDQSVSAANNSVKNVGNCETLVVGVNASLEVGAAQTIKVTKGYKNSIAADQIVTIGADRSVEVNAVAGLTVGGDSHTGVGGSQKATYGNALDAILALAAERAVAIAEAMASHALRQVDAAIQGKLVQALGPLNQTVAQAQALGNGMQLLANGDLGAAGAVMAGAAGLPGAAALASALVPSGGGGGGASGGGGSDGGGSGGGGGGGSGAQVGASAGVESGFGAGGFMPSLTNARLAARGAALQGIQAAGAKARELMAPAKGGGGGGSQANVGGPEGSVDGVDEADREAGPGHGTFKVAGAYQEKVGSTKTSVALDGLTTEVAGSMTRSVGAAHLQLVLGDHVTTASGGKDETAAGLVVVTARDETEASTGARTTMVGGAVSETVKGKYAVQAGAAATFVGALHKVEASGSITFKCGGSEVVIDGGGVTIKASRVTLTAAKIQLPKATHESG